MVTVISVTSDEIHFSDGTELYSEHISDCCESHYLDFSPLTLKDFDDMKFDLSSENFFERIDGYGIALKPLNGWAVRIAGYGSNNGYYSSNLDLILLKDGVEVAKYSIDECQDW